MVPLISVIIPNYNEIDNLRRGVLNHVNSYLKKQTFTWEVIIVDDGSTDASVTFLADFAKAHSGFRILKGDHSGKPFALRLGIKAAKGKYCLLTDMDQSTPIKELDKLLPYINDFKVIIGSRGASRSNSSFVRKYVVSLGFLTVRRLILLPRIIDTQCGFKLIETRLAKTIFSLMRLFTRDNQAVGWKVTAYDVEMLFLARKLGYLIKEVRVAWRDEDTSVGKSRNFVKESIEMFTEILRVRLNDIRGRYHQ